MRSALDSSPIAGARVNLGGPEVFTGSDGSYQMSLPVGPVNVQVSAFSYLSQTVPAEIVKGETTIQNFSLDQAVMVPVSGTVTDGAGHAGMPLYARIDIPGIPISPVFSDPGTGQYQLSLEQGSSYTFNVTAVQGGYLAENRAVIPPIGGSEENFSLLVDPAACPPGYLQGSGNCTAQSGGLIVGYVQDANDPPHPNPIGLPGATITNSASGVMVTAASHPEGYYELFTPEGGRSISASYPGYTGQSVSVQVTADRVTGLTFNLPAGFLQVTPDAVNLSVTRLSPTADAILNFSNQGVVPAAFHLAEFSGPAPDLTPNGPFAAAGRRLSPSKLNALTAEKIYEYVPPAAPVWPGGGSTLRSWSVGLVAPWGLGLDQSGNIWLSDVLPGGGDGQDHLFDLEGGSNAGVISTAWGGDFAADMAYDPLGDRLWQVNAGGDNCLYELDPQQQVATGGRICPPFGNSQRGLAYDPYTQTFFSGTWNDAILTHFDRSGTILDSVNTGINIAGLAYQPVSGHVYVLANGAAGFDVYVLDARHGYAVLGGFDVPGLTDFGQAGMEFAPDGSLWLVDTLGGQVFQVSSGETAFSPVADVPWLTASPTSATLPGAENQPVTISVDGTGLTAGLYQAYLTVTTDTPYDLTPYKIDPIPVNLTVLPIYAVELSPVSQLGMAAAGRSVTYAIQVTNTGDYAETYTVSAGAHTWAVNLPAALNAVPAGGMVVLQVTVSVPPATPIGQFEEFVVTVRSTSDPLVFQTATLKTICARAIYMPIVGR